MDEDNADNDVKDDDDDKIDKVDKTGKGDKSENDIDHKSYVRPGEMKKPLLIELQECRQRKNCCKSVRWSAMSAP